MGDQKGLVIVSYVAPGVALEKGRYNVCRRDQFDLRKRVREQIIRNIRHL